MTDLPKLELDEHYYLKLKNGKIEVQKFIGGFVLRNDDEIAEVLDKVPNYEEWQRALHYAGKYEFEYTSCVMDYEKLKQENTKLKELLKECKHIMSIEKDFASCHFEKDRLVKLLAKINEVLK